MNSWDTRYASEEFAFGTEPNDFLVEASEFLPKGGHVVSLGEGEGRNGVWLAERGFRVTAIDGSAVGLAKAARFAASRGVVLETIVGDLEELALPENADAIVSIFCHLPSPLRRTVCRRAVAALRPGGVAIFEAYHLGRDGMPPRPGDRPGGVGRDTSHGARRRDTGRIPQDSVKEATPEVKRRLRRIIRLDQTSWLIGALSRDRIRLGRIAALEVCGRRYALTSASSLDRERGWRV